MFGFGGDQSINLGFLLVFDFEGDGVQADLEGAQGSPERSSYLLQRWYFRSLFLFGVVFRLLLRFLELGCLFWRILISKFESLRGLGLI